MTTTFRRHFDDDISRAESLLSLANGASPALKKGSRTDDVRLAAVAMAVGAMDAYFCDAYVDCLAKRLQSFKVGVLDLPPSYAQRSLPAEALIRPTQTIRPNWALRMAARGVMERENVLDLNRVADLFNPVLPKGQKLWPSVMGPIIHMDWKRLTGMGTARYQSLGSKEKAGARASAVGTMKKRLKGTIQIRHDWIHNCGRPKSVIRQLTVNQADARIREVRLIVETVDQHLMAHRVV